MFISVPKDTQQLPICSYQKSPLKIMKNCFFSIESVILSCISTLHINIFSKLNSLHQLEKENTPEDA